MGHKVECYHYKINTSAKEGAEKEAGKSQEALRQNSIEEAGDAFGPWVLVLQKRQPNRKMLIDKDQPSHLGPYDQSLRNQFVSSPYRPALSSDKAGEDNSGGKRKPMHSPGHSASWVEYSEEPISSSKPTSRLKMLGAKGSEPGAKSTKIKKKNQDATGRKNNENKSYSPYGKKW